MYISRKYYPKTGLALAIFLPGVFVFDRVGGDAVAALLLFLDIFFFILLLWLFNATYVDFSNPTAASLPNRKAALTRRVGLSLFLSLPLYYTLGLIFRQQDILFASLLNSNFSVKAWFYMVLRIMLFDVGLLAIKFFIDHNKEKQRIALENEVFKNEQLRATHESFRQQVDPHFLFNALSTMQSLVKQDQKENTLQFIGELSRVYRYMLIQRDRDIVSVGEEITFLESYLYLLHIRFGEAFQTEILVSELHRSTPVPVHTLQLLAENAVKHNVVSKRKPLRLCIQSVKDRLVISNNLRPKGNAGRNSGIGLQNIAKRYALLFEKEIYITATPESFTVSLPIIDRHENTDH
jgi:two-component system, LytTR family, sensor kinase